MHIIQNRFNIGIQINRTDNGTEYVNDEFRNFLSEKRMLHQTSCPAERKNRRLLEVNLITYVYYKCA
jgi:hypothetical protein